MKIVLNISQYIQKEHWTEKYTFWIGYAKEIRYFKVKKKLFAKIIVISVCTKQVKYIVTVNIKKIFFL